MADLREPRLDTELQDLGREWLEEVSVSAYSDEIELGMKSAYIAGGVIFLANRAANLGVIEEHGGVKRIHGSRFFDDFGKNFIQCKDGFEIKLSKFLHLPKAVLNTKTISTNDLPFEEPPMQQHSIRVSFGGGSIGKSEKNADEVDRSFYANKILNLILEDPNYIPEDFGLTEELEINTSDNKNIFSKHYSMHGQIWYPHLDSDPEPIPDYWTDPQSYRRWAMSTNRGITDLNFTAPTEMQADNGQTYIKMATVINEYGSMPHGRVHAISSFVRYSELLKHYCMVTFPEVFEEDTDTKILPTTIDDIKE